MNDILIDNAIQSWINTIKYAEKLKNGIATLENRKMFVSLLHNTVELIVKQIMLNQNDYRVASYSEVEKDGTPLKDYYSSQDLNHYFESMNKIERNKFKTIEFNKIHEKLDTILVDYKTKKGMNEQEYKDYISAAKGNIKLLKNLRNSEMHFFIKSSDFLTNSEFVSLYNFMIDFIDILDIYEFIPITIDDELSMKDLMYRVSKDKLDKSFDYKNRLVNNERYMDMKKYFDTYDIENMSTFRNKNLEFATNYCISIIGENYSLEDIYKIYEYINAASLFNLTGYKEKTKDGIKTCRLILK